MARIKKHHYVPQGLLKHFCFEDRSIWYTKRDENGAFLPIERRNISSTFQRRNYYSIIHNRMPSDLAEKKIYGRIDDSVAKFVDTIHQVLDANETPVLSDNDLQGLRKFIPLLVKRTPDFMKYPADEEIGEKHIQSLIETMEKSGDPFNELDSFKSRMSEPGAVRLFGANLRVRAQLASSPKISDAMSDFSVRWGIIDGKHSFVISGKMLLLIGNGGSNGIGNPNVELWLPISPKRCLILLRDPTNRIPLVSYASEKMTREINEYAVENSTEVASHSEKLLASLTGAKIKKT